MWDYRTEIYTIGSRKRWPSPQIQKLSSFVSFFWLSHVACRILVSHLGMESWHWKHQVLTPDNHGIPRKSPLITGTSPTLLCDLCSCHPPFFPSTPTMPAFILFPEYVTLISTHRAFAVPSVMDSSAKYLCVAASFLSDQVSSSQKKKKKNSSLFHYLCHGLLLQSHFQTYTVVSSWKDLRLLKWPCVCVLLSSVQLPNQATASLRARPLYFSTQLIVEETLSGWTHTTHTHTHTSHCLPTRTTALQSSRNGSKENPPYLVREESMSSTSLAKCFLCFWIFGISTCG